MHYLVLFGAYLNSRGAAERFGLWADCVGGISTRRQLFGTSPLWGEMCPKAAGKGYGMNITEVSRTMGKSVCCPECGAEVGENCRKARQSRPGGIRYRTANHRERQWEYLRLHPLGRVVAVQLSAAELRRSEVIERIVGGRGG